MANVVLDFITDGSFATSFGAEETAAFAAASAALSAFTPLVDLLAMLTAGYSAMELVRIPHLAALTTMHKTALQSLAAAKLSADGLDGAFELRFVGDALVIGLSRAGYVSHLPHFAPNFLPMTMPAP